MIANEHRYRAIAEAVGTPYYCYDASDIRVQFQRLRTSLPDIGCLYSVKANPNKAIIEILHSEGAGCEVCSLAELETALAAGVAPNEIIFVGPGKSIDELTRCIQLGIRAVIAESYTELKLLERIACSRGVVQAVGLRINPALRPAAAKLVMSGKPTQFGIEENQLPEAVTFLCSCQHLTLVGIHVYFGSRILDAAAIRYNTDLILQLAVETAELAGHTLAFVDVGGGFGVKYFPGEPELDLTKLGTEMAGVIHDFTRRSPTTKIIMELGRFLVAHAGVFVTSVRYIKRCGGKLFAICDGGSNCHATAAGIGCLFRRNFPIARLTGTRERGTVYTLTGPLCTPTDVIGEDIALGDLECGDLVGIFQSGAYGASASPVHFLGFGHPAEVLIDDDNVRLIRGRTSVCELIDSQISVPLELTLCPAERELARKADEPWLRRTGISGV
jgi:diaminopimelate decarboxylase